MSSCLYASSSPSECVSPYTGRSGVREWVADMRDAWERMEVRPLEIVDAGNPIVSLGHAHLRARGSGVEFDYQLGAVFWSEQGLIVRELHFSDWNEALRVAGINADPKVAGTKRAPLHRATLSQPTSLLTLDVFPRVLAEVGRTEDEDLEALRPGLVPSPCSGRNAHDVPLLDLDDLVVELHPPAPAHDHVHLLLLLVRVAVREPVVGGMC